MATKVAAGWLLAATHLSGHAGVTETREKQLYEVRQAPGMTLMQALNESTPIRGEGGHRYHGHTQWNVQWHYRYHQRSDGMCSVTAVDVKLNVTMTLPALKASADDEAAARFTAYLPNLVSHEEGHARIGQAVARSLDVALTQLQPMPSCPLLEREVARVAADALDRGRREDKAYDAATRHGCTQGACLTR